ncbi:transcription factor 7 isoform X6 [Pan paniscus]|uniref:transcription factor 7 isoform X5 n=1 Tax=Homo sapiens TaxID=9606 RepID=UPI001FB1854F|nr:transcription factor 7 isoform X5 [Homo sapiens]
MCEGGYTYVRTVCRRPRRKSLIGTGMEDGARAATAPRSSNAAGSLGYEHSLKQPQALGSPQFKAQGALEPGHDTVHTTAAMALGREHAAQRLFPDKLPEPLEDGLKAPECTSGMYKETVYSAFNLLMHYPPPSGAGQHPQPQPPLHKANQPPHGVPQLSLYEHFNSPHPTPAPADISQKQVHRPLQTPDLSGFYSLTSGSMGQLPHTVSWPSPPLYPLSPSCGYRQHFPAPTAAPGAPYPRFTHPSLMLGSGVPGHPAAIPHPAIVPPSGKQELQPFDRNLKTQAESKAEKEAKKPTIKKPLNAFMLYMKEMRAKVIAECTLKESAAINQILGRRWHALSREEQAKYYELARKERQLHMQLYPGWSARDNYGKKKRRSREKHQESTTGGKRNAFGTYPEKAAAPAPFLPMTVL